MYDRLRSTVDQVEGYCTGAIDCETWLFEKYKQPVMGSKLRVNARQ